jgi:CRP/FNR family cyclic AMP-dependent transcriptional regulator
MADNSPLFEHFGKTFEEGCIIFEEGASAREMYIIQSGRVKVVKKIHNSQHLLAELGKGDFFGEMAIVTNDTRFATAVALSQVETLAFTRDDLANLITKNAKVAFNIIEKLCRRLQNANLNIKHLLNTGKLGIVSLLLLDLFSCVGESEGLSEGKVKAELSRKLKVSEGIISYFLEIFKTDRSIEYRDDELVIGNRAKLEKYAITAFAQE